MNNQNIVSVVGNIFAQMKTTLERLSRLFQILVLLDTISDWPRWVSWQHFYSQGLPTKKLTGNTAHLPSLWSGHTSIHLQFFLFRWPSKEQVHEERVEPSDLCLWLKSAASLINPLNILANAVRPILSTSVKNSIFSGRRFLIHESLACLRIG